MEVYLYELDNLVELSLKFDPYIFHTPKHLLTQSPSTIFCFYLFRKVEDAATAIFQCVSDHEKNWLSPAKAPFGGIQCDESCVPEDITFFIQCIEQWISSCGGNRISLKTPPSCYDENVNVLISNCLGVDNYTKTTIYANHHIVVTSNFFESIIRNSEKEG